MKEKTPKISPYLTMYSFKNFKPLDTGKFNGDGSFSGVFALQGDVLMSRAAHGAISIFGLISLLASQINHNSQHTKKESKKSEMPRTIKNIYHIDE